MKDEPEEEKEEEKEPEPTNEEFEGLRRRISE